MIKATSWIETTLTLVIMVSQNYLSLQGGGGGELLWALFYGFDYGIYNAKKEGMISKNEPHSFKTFGSRAK